jgi:uncharacterized membrane protein
MGAYFQYTATEENKLYICSVANKTSQHILSTAANLLGFCLFVITALHISNKTENSIIDELTSVIAVMLTFSCMFSFMSIKTSNSEAERKLEKIADYIFFSSLIGILIVILLITLNFIK